MQVSGDGASSGFMVFGTVGTMCRVAVLVVSVTKFLALVTSDWLLDVLTYNYPGVYKEEIGSNEVIKCGGK